MTWKTEQVTVPEALWALTHVLDGAESSGIHHEHMCDTTEPMPHWVTAASSWPQIAGIPHFQPKKHASNCAILEIVDLLAS